MSSANRQDGRIAVDPASSIECLGGLDADPLTNCADDLVRDPETALQIVIVPEHHHLVSEGQAGQRFDNATVCYASNAGAGLPRQRPIGHVDPLERDTGELLKVVHDGLAIDDQKPYGRLP